MKIETIAQLCIEAIKRGNFIFCIGNGGSAAMATHFAGELQGKFNYNRKPLPGISLFDLASTTAIANDLGYDQIFVRPLMALGRKGDVLIALSTSGKSRNVNLALDWAKKNELIAIEIPRKGTGTAKIQEAQLRIIHELARLIEEAFL